MTRAVTVRLTRKELERYKQNMVIAADGGDLWSDEYCAFARLCDEVLALRAEVKRLRAAREGKGKK